MGREVDASGGLAEPWEPEYLIADLAAALARARAFTLRCSELAPELQVAAQGVAGRQEHLFETTRRAVLRRSTGST